MMMASSRPLAVMSDNWDCILFDADDTLFHFDAYAGLQRLFAGYDVQFRTSGATLSFSLQ
jgi:FMN phosphatase YigB (HAD superfamily)